MKMILCLLCLFLFSKAEASSVFMLKRGGHYVVAKSFGAESGIGYLIVNPRNHQKVAFGSVLPNNKWISRYGSVTFNQISVNMPVGGVNEKGLMIDVVSAYEMNMMNQNSDITLNEFETVQYLLDNFDSVDKAVEEFKNIEIKVLSKKVHYFIADKTGKSAVVELLDGKVLVVDDKNPNYTPILSKTRYLKSISALIDNKPRRNIGDKVFSNIFTEMQSLDTTQNIENNALEILSKIEHQGTRWNIIYDISDNEVAFSSNNSPLFKTVKLDEIDFASAQHTFVDVNTLNLNPKFKPLTNVEISNLMNSNLSKYDMPFLTSKGVNTIVYGTLEQQQQMVNARNKKLGTLRVNISNLDNNRGVLRIAIYDSEKGFDEGEPYKTTQVSVANNSGKAFFYNLQLDKYYVIYYYHDENTNNRVDRQWVGLPNEDYGFSGESGDSFETARFKLSEQSFGEYNIENSSFLIW